MVPQKLLYCCRCNFFYIYENKQQLIMQLTVTRDMASSELWMDSMCEACSVTVTDETSSVSLPVTPSSAVAGDRWHSLLMPTLDVTLCQHVHTISVMARDTQLQFSLSTTVQQVIQALPMLEACFVNNRWKQFVCAVDWVQWHMTSSQCMRSLVNQQASEVINDKIIA